MHRRLHSGYGSGILKSEWWQRDVCIDNPCLDWNGFSRQRKYLMTTIGLRLGTFSSP